MIRRSVYVQLAAFFVISVVGIFYVGANYVGFFQIHGPYTVHLLLPDSGGIFTNADVSERGVVVGKVGSLTLVDEGGACHVTDGCLQANLSIDNGKKIATKGLHATVADLSAVGEQYVDLEPTTEKGPYLHSGSSIPSTSTTLPVPNSTILVNTNDLLNSVNDQQLATVISELGKGFNNLGPTLQSLIDNGDALTKAAIAALPQTLTLINDGKTVLDTQNQVSGEFKTFARTFREFSAQLKSSDPDLRTLFRTGASASTQVTGLLKDNEAVLPTLLSNLITTNEIQDLRLPQIRTTLLIYSADTAAGFHVTPGDGTAHFGLVIDSSQPCTTGYSSTVERPNTPANYGGPANLDAYCHGDVPAGTDVRGSRFIPRPAGDNSNITNDSPGSYQQHYGGAAAVGGTPSPSPSTSSLPTTAPTGLPTTLPTTLPSGIPSLPIVGGLSKGQSSSAQDSAYTYSGPTLSQIPDDPMTTTLLGLNAESYRLGIAGMSAPTHASSWEQLIPLPTMAR